MAIGSGQGGAGGGKERGAVATPAGRRLAAPAGEAAAAGSRRLCTSGRILVGMTGTTPPDAPLRPRFVLIEPRHAGNVGAAARALKTMGFDDLVLVRPREANVQRKAEAIALSSGAHDVLARARVVDTVEAALEGVTHVSATAMTPRDFGPPNHAPRELFAGLAAAGHRVAFLFGSERHGMTNDDVHACHACVSIPTDPVYGSLNLAQAVQLLAYEWRLAIGGFAGPASPAVAATNAPRRADEPAVRGLVRHWQAVLERIGFLDPETPRKLMPRLLRFVHRAQPTVEEVHILRGIARAVEREANGASRPRPGPAEH